MSFDAARATQLFDRTGRQIDAEWGKAGYDVHALPEIAAASLRTSGLAGAVSAEDILRWVLTVDLPQQFDLGAAFGEPPVTLFRTDRFFIQALFWHEGSTAIHHHGFSGAFLVLTGSSIHTTWTFAEKRRINEFLLLGDLAGTSVHLIGPGAVEPITADLIHCVFHLEVPSVTIVVRTYSDFLPHPQYNYLKPHIAMYPPGKTATLTRRLQALRLRVRLKSTSMEEEVLALLGRCDLQTAFFICEELFAVVEPDLFERMLSTLDIDRSLLDAVFAHQRREAVLSRARSRESDEDLRFFLALLLTLDFRADIVRLVRERTGSDDPSEAVAGWVARLAEAKTIEIPGDRVNTRIFRAMLRGESDDGVIAGLVAEYGEQATRAQEKSLREQLALFRGSVLAPLFA